MIADKLVEQVVEDSIKLLDDDMLAGDDYPCIYRLLSKIMVLIQKTQRLSGPEKKELAIRTGRIVLQNLIKRDESILLKLYDASADEIIEVLYWTSKHLRSCTYLPKCCK